MLPLQGGTNDFIVKKLYEGLAAEKRSKLKVRWYTARDMLQPINAVEAVRTCHSMFIPSFSYLYKFTSLHLYLLES